jgi:predicted CXXCH cytochrome family protein
MFFGNIVPFLVVLSALPAVAPAAPLPGDGKPATETKAAPPAKPAAPQSKPSPATSPAAPAAKPAAVAAVLKPMADEENSCIACHRELTEKDQQRAHVTPQDFAADVHWQLGLRCQDCHGGDPTVFEIKAHQAKGDFRAVKTVADIPEFCGACHANIEYIKRFRPSLRTDQLAQYLTSGHGKKLKTGDLKVATCISCHDVPHGNGLNTAKHGIRAITDLESPVYHTRVATTCAKCHADAELMAGRSYHGTLLGHSQYTEWRQSVHGKALMDKGDLSAPTCNNCHGNHGAVPPEIGSVANACGSCHGKVAGLFAQTQMKHKFENVGLPGCATCHTKHSISKPSDVMLGMESGAVCRRCHAENKFGAPLAGGEVAAKMRQGMDDLSRKIAAAQQTITQAGRLGMEVRGPRYDLRKASDSLTGARVQIHSFALAPVQKALGEGLAVTASVQAAADAALAEHRYRRVWLGWSLIPIGIVIGVLLLYIRSVPIPPPADPE